MKVVILSSSDSSGGAAIASYRLHNALNRYGVQSDMLVRHKCKPEDNIEVVDQINYFKNNEIHPRFALEKMFFIPFEKSKKERFAFSTGQFGFQVQEHPLIKKADIIHLHWINGGFLSIKSLHKLFKLGKPVVWTMHDMWPFTGGCHYVGNCQNYLKGCGSCPLLKRPSKNDCSARLFFKKEKIYTDKNITFVGCSNWMADIARTSILTNNKNILAIPNPIDQTLFFSNDKLKSKLSLGLNADKITLLFAAGNIFDERKGIKYLVEALKILSVSSDISNRLELIVIGKSNTELTNYFPVPVNYLGQISGTENMREIYSAADAFLLPSLQDNLPNTIMESLACGTPVIAFKTGGVPEMIEHKITGFLADEKSGESLADGIKWLMENVNKDFINPCTEFVSKHYSEKIVASRYLALYESLLKNGK
jgi:glycosyltransferase involved in cell wall biosynthesis